MSNKKFIVVEGLIGAGKTSFIKLIESKYPNVKCIYEPVKEWIENGELDLFYKYISSDNPEVVDLACYNFQTYTFVTRIQSWLNAVEYSKDTEIFLLDRSIFSDRYFFVQNLYETGKLSLSKYNIYIKWWNMWSKIVPFNITHFIYLKVTPEVALERVKIRNRGEETNLSLEYQQQLYDKHEQFFNNLAMKNTIIDVSQVDYINTEEGKKYVLDIFEKLI